MRVRTRVAALLLAAPLALTACGGSDSPNDSGSATPAAGQAAGATIPAVAPGAEVDKDTFVEVMSAAQQEAKTFSMNMDMDLKSGAQSTKMTMTGVADMSDPAAMKMQMNMTVPGSNAPMDMIMLGKDLYMKVPQAGDKYLQMNMEDLVKATGQDLTSLMDPAKQLERSKAAITKVTYVGDEDVAGVKTRHYTATMDGEAAMQMSGQSLPAEAASSLKLPDTIPFDMWLDDRNLTRKMTMATPMGEGTSMSMTGTFDKFGEPVTIATPPASQVTTMPAPTGTATASN